MPRQFDGVVQCASVFLSKHMMMMMMMMMMLMSGPNIKLHNNYPVMDVFVFKAPATRCTGRVECGQALRATQ